MKRTQSNYFRFVRLRLRGYKIFGSFNDFRFNQERTLIIGANGTGKTIIVEALESLGASRSTQPFRVVNSHGVSSVAVVTEGDCELIKKYRSLIFLNRESLEYLVTQRQDPVIKNMVPDSARGEVASKTREFFQSILSFKEGKLYTYRDLNPHIMAAGEKICFGFAFVFAVREALKLDIPVVLDSPYAMLDEVLRKGVRNFLESQSCQQILLGHECEFTEEEKPKYILVHVEDHSHVMEY